MDTEHNLTLAHRLWNEEVAGANALAKRVQRLAFRVPHYQTDAALQAEWERRRDGAISRLRWPAWRQRRWRGPTPPAAAAPA